MGVTANFNRYASLINSVWTLILYEAHTPTQAHRHC